MKLSFKDITNKEAGKTAIVVGLGKSAMYDIEKINHLYGKDGYVIISCNDFDLMTRMNVHYWVHANSLDTIFKNHQRYNAKNATIVYADTVDLTPQEFVHKNLTVDYLPYDQRHFNFKRCEKSAPCCNNFQMWRPTIQEELLAYSAFEFPYSTGDTVALHMLALAILLGCKKIFITGVDLDYGNGYVNGGNIPHLKHPDLNQYLPRILKDFEIIGLSAINADAEVFISNENTKLKSLFNINPIP